jgi:hypothetical protein
MGVILTSMTDDDLMQAAIADAYASCSLDEGVILYTLEFLHPTFDKPARVVRWPVTSNEIQTFSLKLEPEAPANPGEFVDFIHAPFEVTIPAQEENAPGEFTIKIEHVGHLLSRDLLSAVRQREPLRMIFREYLKNMPETPQLIYTDFSIAAVTVSNNAVEGTATMIDWLKRVYGRIYTPSEFPGLVRGR